MCNEVFIAHLVDLSQEALRSPGLVVCLEEVMTGRREAVCHRKCEDEGFRKHLTLVDNCSV
jgi:hypothetical protein